jgi:hypothetical protein
MLFNETTTVMGASGVASFTVDLQAFGLPERYRATLGRPL